MQNDNDEINPPRTRTLQRTLAINNPLQPILERFRSEVRGLEESGRVSSDDAHIINKKIDNYIKHINSAISSDDFSNHLRSIIDDICSGIPDELNNPRL